MKLIAGQLYVRNDGVVIKLIANPHTLFESPWKFYDPDNKNLYTEDGIHGDSLSDDWDIAGPYVPKEKR